MKGIYIRNCIPPGDTRISCGAKTARRYAGIFQAVIDETGAIIRIRPAGSIRIGFADLRVRDFDHTVYIRIPGAGGGRTFRRSGFRRTGTAAFLYIIGIQDPARILAYHTVYRKAVCILKAFNRARRDTAEISCGGRIEISKLTESCLLYTSKEIIAAELGKGTNAQALLQDGLLVGMAVIGEKFKNNQVYVPEVLIAARAMQAGIDVLAGALAAEKVESKGKVVLGTVKGDLHDIGTVSYTHLDVYKRQDMSIVNAGGVIVRPLPDCSEETLTEIEKRAGTIANYAMYMLSKGARGSLEQIFEGMEMEILEEQQPLWQCDCSKERLEEVVISLGKHEIQDMIEKDDGAEIVCRFCNKKYWFSAEELKRLLEQAVKE